MKKSLVALAILVLVLAACGPAQVETIRETVVTIQVPATVEVPVVVTQEVPVTVIVVPTARATTAPTPAPTSEAVPEIAANYVVSQTQGGVTISIVRVVCGDRDYLAPKVGLDKSSEFDNVKTACEFILEVKNASGHTIHIYPDQGQVVIGDEQIEPLTDYHGSITSMEDISGEIKDGVRRVGGFWFGVRRTAWNEIARIGFYVGAAVDESFKRLGDDFSFEISTEGWGLAPLPDELKP